MSGYVKTLTKKVILIYQSGIRLSNDRALVTSRRFIQQFIENVEFMSVTSLGFVLIIYVATSDYYNYIEKKNISLHDSYSRI